MGNWTECDKKCSTGKRLRKVRCVIVQLNGSRRVVPDESCIDSKPDTEENCNTQECPQWYEGLWSEVSLVPSSYDFSNHQITSTCLQCSESCGNGTQTRPVVCRDSQGLSR